MCVCVSIYIYMYIFVEYMEGQMVDGKTNKWIPNIILISRKRKLNKTQFFPLKIQSDVWEGKYL